MTPPPPPRRGPRAFPVLRAAHLAPGLLLALASCCDLALLLCGPDRSRWVRIGYETPEQALATFLEAVRRDQVGIIYESLATEFKVAHGVPGQLEAEIAWRRMQDEVSGAHLLGSAEAHEVWRTADRCRYELRVAGQRFHLDLVRTALALVRYRTAGGEDLYGMPIESVGDHTAIQHDGLEATAVLTVSDLVLPDGLRAADILEVCATHEWKVAELRALDSTS
jgi:hypothetical protein